MKGNNLDLSTGPIGPLLWKMSMPSIAAMLVAALYNFVDVFWVAKTGSEAVAALTIVFPLQMIFSAIAVGTGVGAGSYAARMFGAGRDDLADRTAGQGIFLSVFFGIASILIGLFFPVPLLKIFGAPDQILGPAKDYLIVFILSIPFSCFVIIAANLFRAEGNPKLSMYIIIISGIIGAILDPFLILGIGPFPAMGITGAALAFVIGNAGTTLVAFYFILKKRSRYRLRWSDIAPDFPIMRSIYAVGLPAFIMNVTLTFVFAVFNHVLAPFGPDALAVLGFLFRINGLVVWVLFGIGHGVMPLVGFSYGANLYGRLVEVVSKAVRISILIGGISFVLVELFAAPVLSLFTTDSALISMAIPALRIYSSTMAIIGPLIIWISMFNGLGKGFTSMIFLVGRDMLLLIPLLFIFPLRLGLTGVWLAQPVSNALVFVILYYWARKELKGLSSRSELYRRAA